MATRTWDSYSHHSRMAMGGHLRQYWLNNESFTARKASGELCEFHVFMSQFDEGYSVSEKGADGKWFRVTARYSWNWYSVANHLYNYLMGV